MKWRLRREADGHSADKEIPHFLWNMNDQSVLSRALYLFQIPETLFSHLHLNITHVRTVLAGEMNICSKCRKSYINSSLRELSVTFLKCLSFCKQSYISSVSELYSIYKRRMGFRFRNKCIYQYGLFTTAVDSQFRHANFVFSPCLNRFTCMT